MANVQNHVTFHTAQLFFSKLLFIPHFYELYYYHINDYIIDISVFIQVRFLYFHQTDL